MRERHQAALLLECLAEAQERVDFQVPAPEDVAARK